MNIDDKPDKETELLKIWNGGKIDSDVEEELKKGIKIDYKGISLYLYGFTSAINKKTKEVMLAYKIKDKTILLYNPHKVSLEQMELKKLSKLGFEIMDLDESLESTYQEMKLDGDKDGT